ncbi:MAG: acetyl-CoA hydrolase/transferase C-terminal domain-containing protein [Oscillospiraceae bacterium]
MHKESVTLSAPTTIKGKNLSIAKHPETSDRILSSALAARVMTAEAAASMIHSGMTLCTSGFGTGYPKAIPSSLAADKHATDLTLIAGASRGEMLDGAMSKSGILKKHSAFQFNSDMRDEINLGNVEFVDYHLSQLAGKIRKGVYGKIDFAIIECCKINADGSIIPTLSAGITDTIIDCAEKILLEVNLAVPTTVEGFHDFGCVSGKSVTSPGDRVGEKFLRLDLNKVMGVVITDIPDTDLFYPDVKPVFDDIANNVVALLNNEIENNRLPASFTFQSGMGVVANCVLVGLMTKGYKNLKMYTEVLADQALLAIKDGIISEATTTSLDITPLGFDTLYDNVEFFKEHLVIRPLEITNGSAGIISMDLVSMNTALEADIYGNVNSSHAMGTQMINGLGGSNDFCRNAKLSIFTTPSTAKGGAISRIVPMVSHVDSTEHDVDVIVTEYGYADLRGKSPKERVNELIENCAHPDYRQGLHEYYEEALALCGPCQTPHDLSKALSWHQKYLETGSMK